MYNRQQRRQGPYDYGNGIMESWYGDGVIKTCRRCPFGPLFMLLI